MDSVGSTIKKKILNEISPGFVRAIMNAMRDWVRVLDRDHNVIYMNSAMSKAVDHSIRSRKCYELLGRSEPCPLCTSRAAVFDGQTHEKEEEIDGRIYSVISSPIRGRNGEIIAVVEVLRDITQMKYLQHKLFEQNLKLKNDLDIAKELQCSLLPKQVPDDRVNFSFIYKPCEDLGGDFLDIFRVDNDHIGIYVADVSGHGIAASMLTVFLRSSLNKKLLSPAKALEQLYKQYNNSSFDRNLYITLFYIIIDIKAKSAIYSNAGHNVCPIVFNRGRFEILRAPGIPISDWVEKPVYMDETISLIEGDRLFLYTDGIIDIRDSNGEQFGEDRLLEILLADSSDPSTTLNHIIDKACEFGNITGSKDMRDDITMALLEVK